MRVVFLPAILLLAACDSGADEAEGHVSADEAAASVTLEMIGYPEIEANELYGASCAFGAGDSMVTLVLAMQEAAYIKLEGMLIALPADPASIELPYGTRANYGNTDYSLSLTIGEEEKQADLEAINYSGSFKLTSSAGEPIAQAQGVAQCGV